MHGALQTASALPRLPVVDDEGGEFDWVIVVPFKGAPHGKSRLGVPASEGGGGSFESALDVGFSAEQRSELALAFLHDTVKAARQANGVQRVIVVSSAPELVGSAAGDWRGGAPASALPVREAPVELVADPGAGLNAAFEAGARAGRRGNPAAGIAALTGDLPLVRPVDLQHALLLATRHPLGVVADRSGAGTTMITVRPGERLTPRFGVGSFAAHRASGYTPLDLEVGSPLRFDIDSAADLRIAATASPGLGAETRAVVERLLAAT
jgi:2-phospho-L-lactate/phosphoenolpyruvate guanylyltransferase